MNKMQEFYKKNTRPIDPKHLKKGFYLAVQYGLFWHRARVLDVFSNGSIRVFFVDFGTVDTVDSSDKFRYLQDEFFSLPCQAQRGTLSHIQPINETWPSECSKFFKESLNRQLIDARIFEKNASDSSYQMAMKAFIERNQGKVLITDVLIEKNWCEYDKQFCMKASLDFADYEEGKHLEQPVDDEDDWLPKNKKPAAPKEESFEKREGNSIKKNNSNSSEVMKAFLNSSSNLTSQRRRRIEIPDKKRNIVDHSFKRLTVGSIHNTYFHVVYSINEFYFYLTEEFHEIQEYLAEFMLVIYSLNDLHLTLILF